MSGAAPQHSPRTDDATRASDPLPSAPRSNPFSTRFIQPGAIPYLFPAGVDAAQLVARLSAAGWWGEITGPHGSGKSTLLVALLPRLVEAGKRPLQVTLHNGERSLARHREMLAQAESDSVVIIDGYEQLWPWNRLLLRRFCCRRQAGLIVTSHTPTGLPPLYACAVDRQTAAEVLARLTPAESCVSQADLDRALAANGQNLRDALFELYDLYEQRQAEAGR